jgi:hypothetical protein
MNCARERCRRWAFVFAKPLEATQHALPAMVLHQHNTEHLSLGSKAAPEFRRLRKELWLTALWTGSGGSPSGSRSAWAAWPPHRGVDAAREIQRAALRPFHQIADALTACGISTRRGGRCGGVLDPEGTALLTCCGGGRAPNLRTGRCGFDT